MIQWWYCKKKLDASHSLGLKGQYKFRVGTFLIVKKKKQIWINNVFSIHLTEALSQCLLAFRGVLRNNKRSFQFFLTLNMDQITLTPSPQNAPKNFTCYFLVCCCTWKFVTCPSSYFSYHYYLFIYLLSSLKVFTTSRPTSRSWFLWAAFLCHAPHHFGSSFLRQFSTYSCEISQIYFVWHDNVMLPR